MTNVAIEDLQEQPAPAAHAGRTLLGVLTAVSFCHFLNDMVQSLLPSIYPILKVSFQLDFGQIGVITLVYQITASLLQPVIGHYADKRPMPYSLPIGMSITLAGLVVLALAPVFSMVLVASVLIGMGSAIFHPESSRVSRMASGGKHGFAQSFFQVGGNAGSAVGPLLAALIVLPRGQIGVLWFSIAAVLGIVVLVQVGHWYKARHITLRAASAHSDTPILPLSRGRVIAALAILIGLIFSKYFYLAALTNYYTFYLIERFSVSVQTSQLLLFVFLGAVAAGTLIGGPIGDRFGRKRVIWISILGVLPFTLILPHVNLVWTVLLTVVIGFILASAFSAILVYGQELIPGRVGMVSGLFFGFAFGLGGIGAAVLGKLADAIGVIPMYGLCAWLPAIGLLTVFLPELERRKKEAAR